MPTTRLSRDERPDLWALVEQHAAGDRQAFAEFYRLTRDQVTWYVRRKTRDVYLADDITADTYLRALPRLADLRREAGSPIAWLYTIAFRLISDHYRKADTRMTSLVEEFEALADLIDPTPGPESGRITRDDDATLWRAVDRLTSANRAVVLLRYDQDMAPTEIAAMLGITVGAVKARQHRAMGELSAQPQLRALVGLAAA